MKESSAEEATFEVGLKRQIWIYVTKAGGKGIKIIKIK